MRTPPPPPHQLPLIQPARPRTREEAATEGYTRADLAGPLWRSPFRGVHSPEGQDPTHPHLRLLEAATALVPGTAIGGWAAAWLHGARELDGRPGGTTGEPVLVCLEPAARIVRRAGLRPFRSRLLPGDVTQVGGVLVTSPLRTAFDVARLAPSLGEAVADLDAVCRDAGVSPAEVAEYARQRPRWRGVPLVIRAVELVDIRSRSRGESRLRVLWRCEARLPAPLVNVEVRDGRGHLLALADLLDPEVGLVGEYDGAGHRDVERHTADNGREEGLERAGLVVVRATSLDLAHRLRTVTRLKAAWTEAANRPRGSWAWRIPAAA